MKEEVRNKIANALNALSQANNAMIESIQLAVKESEDNEITITKTIDESCGYVEDYTIEYNEDGDLCMFNEKDYELYHIEDCSAAELHEICIKIS